jgi:hypothetical protein
MDAYPEPTDDNEETVQRGHAGQHHGIGTPECPHSLHHHHDERCEESPQHDISDTPQPQRRVDLYQRKNEISDRRYPRD